jgi:uncharacterized membrane protein YbhN (UPF0104 family)
VAAAGFLYLSARPLPVMLPWVGEWALPLWLAGLGLGVAFLAVVQPAAFTRVSRAISERFGATGSEILPRLGAGLLARGLWWTGLGWVFLGLSQVAVLHGLGRAGPPLQSWPAIAASVALATVAGFAVPIAPGGLGIREWVLWTSLDAARLDHDVAVVAALVLRLVWVAAEVLAAALLIGMPALSGRMRRSC